MRWRKTPSGERFHVFNKCNGLSRGRRQVHRRNSRMSRMCCFRHDPGRGTGKPPRSRRPLFHGERELKKTYIYQFDGSALSPMSALGFSETPAPPEGFETYAIFESPEAERVHSIIAEKVGWREGLDGISHSAQLSCARALSELCNHASVPFTCKKRIGYGESPSPVESLSRRIIDESL